MDKVKDTVNQAIGFFFRDESIDSFPYELDLKKTHTLLIKQGFNFKYDNSGTSIMDNASRENVRTSLILNYSLIERMGV